MSDVEKEREAWRSKARDLAKNIVAPRANEIDAKSEFAWDVVKALGQRGFLSLLIPKEYGEGRRTQPLFAASWRRLRIIAPHRPFWSSFRTSG